MRKLTTTICVTIAVLLGSVGMSASVDFQKGLDAAQNGDLNALFRLGVLLLSNNLKEKEKE